MDNETRKKLDELLEAFRSNPSNSNKYRHAIYALFEDLEDKHREELALATEGNY